MRLRTLQDWVVSPMLKGVPGVTEVNSFGGYIQQFEVLVDPDRLLKYDLSVEGVSQAIRRNNANVGGSIVTRGSEEYIIRGVGMIQSEGDIRSIVLKSQAGTAVTIGDVADVRTGHAVRQGASLKDGRGESVGGIVLMLRGENSRKVVAALEEKVGEINTSRVLPDKLRLVPFYRRSPIVEASTRTVLKALAEGAVLVVVVLLLLLRSARGAFVVIVALPLSILLTFTVLKVARIDANLMSLGGLAISIGMIIDATIIQVENIQRRLGQKGGNGGNGSLKERMATVLAAAVEVRQPSILGELIIALTFVPIITLQGLEGKMFSPLAFTVALALLASLLLSIFVIPVLCLALLKPETKESAVLRAIRRLYLPSLRWTLGHRVAVVVTGGVLVSGALALVPRLGTEFLPIMDEGAFDMDVQLLPGVSLDKALETTLEVEKRLMTFPELQTVVSRTGQTGVAIEARGVDKTGFVGALKPRSEWTSAGSREELADKMREAVADIPGMVASFSQPIQCRIDELVAGTRAQVIVKLFGDDLRVLKQKAGEMARVLAEVRGRGPLRGEGGRPALPDRLGESRADRPLRRERVGRARPDRDGGRREDRVAGLPAEPGGRRGDPALGPAPRLRRGAVRPARGRSGGRQTAAVAAGAGGSAGGAGANQPRGRPAADRRRDERRRPRHRQLRRRGAVAPPGRSRPAGRLLPHVGRAVRESAAGPCGGSASSHRPSPC